MSTKPIDRIDSQGTVSVSVVIAAEVATVWSFFSDASRFAAWIGAFAGQPPLEGTRVEPRIGGRVRVAYPGEQAGVGEITAMEPNRRIAFTWGYEAGTYGMMPGTTNIEVLLSAVEDGTLVELRHTGIPSEDARKGHFGGWKHYLSMLATRAATANHAERLERVMAAWFEAWREADDAKRRGLLEECCEAGVRVRTSWACTDGIEELSGHIANSLKHMPGCTLAAEGAVQHLHGHARVNWTVAGPDGKAIFRGTNFAVLSPRGKIAMLVSFPAG